MGRCEVVMETREETSLLRSGGRPPVRGVRAEVKAREDNRLAAHRRVRQVVGCGPTLRGNHKAVGRDVNVKSSVDGVGRGANASYC